MVSKNKKNIKKYLKKIKLKKIVVVVEMVGIPV